MRDNATTYGEHVANKLRSYADFIRLNTEHKINCILHESDMLMLQQNTQPDYPIHFPGPSTSSSFIPLHSIGTSSGNTHTLSPLYSAPSFTPNNNFSPLPSSSVPFTPTHENNSLNTLQENASPYYNIN